MTDELKLGELDVWRCWRVNMTESRAPLFSRHVSYQWFPNRVAGGDPIAKDIGGQQVRGVYALHRLDRDWFDGPPQYVLVEGRVWLWGTVMEHKNGYRAEYAYPKEFNSVFIGKHSHCSCTIHEISETLNRLYLTGKEPSYVG